MFRQIFRYFSIGTLARFNTTSLPRNALTRPLRIRKHFFAITSVFGIFRVFAMEKQNEEECTINFEEEIKRATTQGEKYLTQLMCVLRTLILQTSIEYQECLIKQIEIVKENTKIGPIGEHWDRLTHFRVQGNELKEELDKYQTLANSIEQIVHQQISLVGNKIILNQLSVELVKVQKLCNEQLQEIHKYEAELLAVNRDSILYGITK